MSQPKVSIVSITYNQEKYIRDALESFVQQQTDFDLEVVIADDASTDKTAAIIHEYELAYPKIFKPILRRTNVGVHENLYGAMRAARGQYIAICEGDDYWTDPQKLQMQVDFLDKHSDYALCFHPVKVVFENNEQQAFVYPDAKDKHKFTVEELLRENYIQTNSVVYRRQNYEHIPDGILPIDWYLHLYHARFGKIGFINRTMSVYRRHAGGIWWDSHNDNKDKFWQKNGPAHLAMYNEVLKLYGDNERYKAIVYEPISQALDAFIELAERDDKTLSQAIKQFPTLVQRFLKIKYAKIVAYDKQEKAQNETIAELKHSLELLQQSTGLQEKQIQELENELAEIKNSRAWHALQKARAAKAKLSRKQ